MYLLFFIYLFIIKQLIYLINGNYINSLSSYIILLNLFSPGDTFTDCLILVLVFFSSIHHSVRHHSPNDIHNNNLYRLIHCCDSGSICALASYIIMHRIDFFPKEISIFAFFFFIWLEYNYTLRYFRKILVALTYIYSISLKNVLIIPVLISVLFFNSKLWDKNNFYRIGWHATSTLCISLYLLHLF